METLKIENQKLETVDKFVQYTDMNIYLTGKAGTGKTTFLRNLAMRTYKRMVIVAPTGVAAINAGGVTIHSFFQLPFGPQLPDDVTKNPDFQDITDDNNMLARQQSAQYQKLSGTKLKIIRSLDLLVIDEISMVRADLLDAIDSVLRRTRHSEKAFGGVQLLMIGDIHQLAPVAKPDEWDLLRPYYESVYFFNSHVLKKAPYICIELEHIYRQEDLTFINILNKVRNNCLDKESIDTLNKHYHPDFEPDDKDGFITLTTHNRQADAINEEKLNALKNKKLTFHAAIEGVFPENSYPTKEELVLKVGAQVMFVKNDPSAEKRYFNGKIGKIVSYDTVEGLRVQCEDEIINVTPVKWQNMEYSIDKETKEIEEKEIGSFTQIPLKTAWAITIHKSQGLTFKKLILDASLAFAHGQVYVALSRCTSLEGLVLKSKISSNGLFNDLDINTFVNKIPSLEPTEEQFYRQQQLYEFSMIMELFNFDNIEMQVNRLAKTIRDNYTIFSKETVNQLPLKRNFLRQEIMDVSLKFGKQVEFIFGQDPQVDGNEYLQDRVKKACIYFLEKIKDIEAVNDLAFECDNKTVNDLIKSILSLLNEQIFIKKACLESGKNGFSIKSYLETKNKKTVEAEDLPKKQKAKAKLKDVPEKDQEIMMKLLSWREEKSDEFDLNPALMIPRSVLVEIAKRRPITAKELKGIPKLGSMRIKRFGNEILNIVLQEQGFKPIEIDPIEIGNHDITRNIYDTTDDDLTPTYSITKNLLKEGMSIKEVAEERGFSVKTVEGHIVELVKKEYLSIDDYVSKEHQELIKEYFMEVNDSSLSAARDVLGEDFSYLELKLVLMELRKNGEVKY